MNVLTRLTNYLKASQQELKKVVWPSKKEVIRHTLLVIGISVGVAAFLGIADKILELVISFII
ncbi:MAG: preprotein translocase subunit SecE [Patescibacteria group bacterium]|jgi:preprotein translocase subunit SecE